MTSSPWDHVGSVVKIGMINLKRVKFIITTAFTHVINQTLMIWHAITCKEWIFPFPFLLTVLPHSSFSTLWPCQTTTNLSAQLVSTILRFDGWGFAKPNYISFIFEAYVKELVFFFFCTFLKEQFHHAFKGGHPLNIQQLHKDEGTRTNQHIDFFPGVDWLGEM